MQQLAIEIIAAILVSMFMSRCERTQTYEEPPVAALIRFSRVLEHKH